MKKIFAIILVFIILAVSLISCSNKSSSVEDCCEEVISLMKEIVDCEQYSKMYNLPTQYDDTIAKLKSIDYSKLEAIYELDMSESSLLSDEIDVEELSDELNNYVHSALYLSIASQINKNAGVEFLSVSAALAAQKSFMCKSIK